MGVIRSAGGVSDAGGSGAPSVKDGSTPRSPQQPEGGPFGKKGGISGRLGMGGASGGARGAIGDLEESQKLLEDKLAALKKKMDQAVG